MGEEKNKKTNTNKRSRGGQPGNNNAIGNRGGSAPKGNKNARKHGIYEIIELQNITDEKEIALINEPFDKYKEVEIITKILRLMRYRAIQGSEIEEKILTNLMTVAIKAINQHHKMKKDDEKSNPGTEEIMKEWLEALTESEPEE